MKQLIFLTLILSQTVFGQTNSMRAMIEPNQDPECINNDSVPFFLNDSIGFIISSSELKNVLVDVHLLSRGKTIEKSFTKLYQDEKDTFMTSVHIFIHEMDSIDIGITSYSFIYGGPMIVRYSEGKEILTAYYCTYGKQLLIRYVVIPYRKEFNTRELFSVILQF